MTATCDILIIGGGVVGVSIAWALARRRAGRVVLLEKAFVGAGGSGRAAGLTRQHDAHAPTATLALLGLRAYEQFPDAVGGPPVFNRTGLVLVAGAAEADAFQRVNQALARDQGLDLRPLSAAELLDIDPNAHLADDEVAILERLAGVVDAVQVVAGFTEAARNHGADLRQGVEVLEIRVEKGKVVGVATNEGVYACGALVLAAGAWSAALARAHNVVLPVQPAWSPLALIRRPPDCGRRGVSYADLAQGLWFRPAPGDTLLAGTLLADERLAVLDPDQTNEAVDSDWLRKMRQRLSRRYPALHRGYGRGGYGALLAVTPDGRPILDRLPGVEGAFLAAGFNGQGVRWRRPSVRRLAGLIVDGSSPLVDLTAFRLGRFEDGGALAPGLASDGMT